MRVAQPAEENRRSKKTSENRKKRYVRRKLTYPRLPYGATRDAVTLPNCYQEPIRHSLSDRSRRKDNGGLSGEAGTSDRSGRRDKGELSGDSGTNETVKIENERLLSTGVCPAVCRPRIKRRGLFSPGGKKAVRSRRKREGGAMEVQWRCNGGVCDGSAMKTR